MLQLIEKKANPAWDTLDNKFYRPDPKTGELEIDSMTSLIRYVIKNKDEFRE